VQNVVVHALDSAVSPELALVDPELRARAVGDLPHVEPFDFLRLRDLPVEPPREARPALAALAYVAVALLRTCAFDAVVFAAVTCIVLVLSLFS
jgi:hypothetical protein